MSAMEIIISTEGDAEPDAEFTELIERVLAKGVADECITALEVSVVISTDEHIRRLNYKHRGINKPTDVLSFPLYGGDIPESAESLGDIVISLPRAKAQAEEYGHSLRRELAFLAAHGLYHLLGYDHQCQAGEQAMTAKQETLLASLGITREANA